MDHCMLPTIPLLILLAGARPVAPAPLHGELVVRQAYAMYAGKWFKSATLVQRRTAEGRTETWYEALQPPGLDRIDVAPAVTGRALLYRNDSLYEYGKRQLRSAGPGVQPLFALLHDLHSDPPAKTIAMLKRFGFDLGKSHERTWDGERVIVVGALAGDTLSNQFWLEKRRMLLVRLLERNGADPRRPLDARVTGYERAGGGWLERTVRIFIGGQLSAVEDYTNVRINVALEPGLFQPIPYHLPQWVGAGEDLFGGLPNNPLVGGH
jgi:hypothetical protein